MGSKPGAAYKAAAEARAKEIAWAKASIEKKFAERTAEARRVWLAHTQNYRRKT